MLACKNQFHIVKPLLWFYVIGLTVARCFTFTSLGRNFAASWWLSVSRDRRYILTLFLLLVTQPGFAPVAKIGMFCVYAHKQTNQNKTGRSCRLISYFCVNAADDTSHLIILQVTVTAAAAAAICAAITSNYWRASGVKMKIPPVCRSLFRLKCVQCDFLLPLFSEARNNSPFRVPY